MKRTCSVILVSVVLAGVCFGQSPHQVEVVAEVGLTNQTGSTGGTLFTPKETGMFRVNFYVQCTTGDPQNGQGLSMHLQWYDDGGLDRFTFNVADTKKGSPASYTFLIKDVAGVPIDWGVVPKPGDAAVYEVYIALERIGPKVQ